MASRAGAARHSIQNMMNRFFLSALAVGVSFTASVSADDNVRTVQTKLKDGGFYLGEVDGAYSSELAAALTRYQIRNGLPITGQLDVDTSKALGVKAAVTTTASDSSRISETWRQLRKSDQKFLTKIDAGQNRSVAADQSSAQVPLGQSSSAVTPANIKSEGAAVYSPPPDRSMPPQPSNSLATSLSTERLRDYIGAFVLAGLDPHVGAEVDFFADRVQYYNDGMVDREKIQRDLQRYDAQWPERHFWLAGEITVEPQTHNRLRVTFPLRFDLRNGAKHSSGKIDKSLLVEVTGEDLQIVAVNESKAQ